MRQFIHDMIHLTEGEKFIGYWWLWLLVSVVAVGIAYIVAKR